MENVCRVISIYTPKRYILKGLWFGGEKAKKAIVFVHGLTSSPFSHHELLLPLASKDTAVIFFGNRGTEIIAKIHRVDNREKKGYSSVILGEAYEIFTDCVDDIHGVINFLNQKGVKDIYLVGHSTGCQKSIYYLSRPGKQKFVKGVALLCPISDYAYAKKFEKKDLLKKEVDYARKLVKEGKPHELLPSGISSELLDAQRFLSLNTPNSVENKIFCYFDPKQKPEMLQKVKIPILAVFAEKDEYRDRPTKNLTRWFKDNCKSTTLTISVIPDALHSFSGLEDKVCKVIVSWVLEGNS